MTHPKWCDQAGHLSDSNSHFSTVFQIDNLNIYLWGDDTESPLLVIAHADGKDSFGHTFTLDGAQVLSAALISLLMRTDAA